MSVSANRCLLPILLLLAVAIGLSACSSNTSGTAVPQPTTGTTQPSTDISTSSATETTTSEPNSPLAGKDPCTLIPQALKTQLKLGNEQKDNTGEARGCTWDDTDSTYTVDVAIRDTQGIGEFDTTYGPANNTTIGGRAAKLQHSATGSCVIAISATDSSRVDVTTNAGSKEDLACQIDNQVAEAVAGQLPR